MMRQAKGRMTRRDFIKGVAAAGAAAVFRPKLLYANEKAGEKKEKKKYDSKLDGPMLKAASEGDVEKVKALLEKGADPDARNQTNKTTVLMIASKKGYLDVANVLLDAGADVNARNTLGRTPLHMSARNGKNDVVKRLLEVEGINVNAKDAIHKNTPLHTAVSRYQIKTVGILVKDERIDLHAQNEDGNTPLQMAEDRGFDKIAKILKKAGAEY